MWTSRLRRRALAMLPPGKLLPDRQPAYVASWVYVFGVASLAALGVAIVSGFAIALGGVDWWHTNPVGHFFNSLHLWSVELFMALLVIHLWGKFWMSAWRGRRAADLDHRGDRLRRLGGGVLHRLPVAAELRLPMDLRLRQGRLQRGRDRRHLAGDGLRPDAAVARGAGAHRAGRDRRRARAAGALPRRRPTRCPRTWAARARPKSAARPRRPPTPRRGAARPAATTSSRKAPSPRWWCWA